MDQGNVSDCTGSWNTPVIFQLTEIFWDHKFLSNVRVCRKRQVSDCTSSTVFTLSLGQVVVFFTYPSDKYFYFLLVPIKLKRVGASQNVQSCMHSLSYLSDIRVDFSLFINIQIISSLIYLLHAKQFTIFGKRLHV